MELLKVTDNRFGKYVYLNFFTVVTGFYDFMYRICISHASQLGSQGRVVSIVTCLQAGLPQNHGLMPNGQEIFVCLQSVQTSCGPTQPPIHWVLELFPQKYGN